MGNLIQPVPRAPQRLTGKCCSGLRLHGVLAKPEGTGHLGLDNGDICFYLKTRAELVLNLKTIVFKFKNQASLS